MRPGIEARGTDIQGGGIHSRWPIALGVHRTKPAAAPRVAFRHREEPEVVRVGNYNRRPGLGSADEQWAAGTGVTT
jgi:hypothetical protein